MIFQKQRLENGRTEENKWIHPCLTFKALVWFVLLVIFFVPLDKECINEAHSNSKQQIKFPKKQINEGLNLIISFC